MLILRITTVVFVILMAQTHAEKIQSETEEETAHYERSPQAAAPPAYQLRSINPFDHEKIDKVPLKIFLKTIQNAPSLPKGIDAVESSTAAYENHEYRPYLYTTVKTVPTSSGFFVPVHRIASHIPVHGITSHVHKEQNKEKPRKYKFGYRVFDPHTGTDFGHSEVHNGEIVSGYYHVLLPDGRLQNVKYWAGDFGYNAVITYDH